MHGRHGLFALLTFVLGIDWVAAFIIIFFIYWYASSTFDIVSAFLPTCVRSLKVFQSASLIFHYSMKSGGVDRSDVTKIG